MRFYFFIVFAVLVVGTYGVKSNATKSKSKSKSKSKGKGKDDQNRSDDFTKGMMVKTKEGWMMM